MLRCGLLGEKLGHSYSPAIHGMLSDYEYKLYEISRENLPVFLRDGGWDGLNVTIPYKKDVVAFCDELSETAKAIGSVNTLVRRDDGTIYGDNTDAFGFESLVRKNNVRPRGKKTLILGSGGACASVRLVLDKMGAETVVISRSGEDNYENLNRHGDAEIIVNTTPVGMYPGNGISPVDLKMFPRCSAVLDIVYNPSVTELLYRAETLGIPCDNGLHMLVAQAKRSSELFTGKSVPDDKIPEIQRRLEAEMKNIVIIGMPGSGKTTISGLLGEMTGRPVIDTDDMVAESAGVGIPEIFDKFGEEGFRQRETAECAKAGKKSGYIIATGGGCIKTPENYPLLHQNSFIVWIKRDIDLLPREGRPLSAKADLQKMYEERSPLYAKFADITADNNGAPETTVYEILEKIK